MKVEGKAAIVTGGGTGVGRATALALAQRGCAVLVNYSRSQDEAEETAEAIRAAGVAGVAMQADVAEDAACKALVERALKEFGRLDVLVNNAGTTTFVPQPDLDALTDETWEKILAVNLRGPFQCARAARDALCADGGGGDREREQRGRRGGGGQLHPLLHQQGRTEHPHGDPGPGAGPRDPRQCRGPGLHHRPLAAQRPGRRRLRGGEGSHGAALPAGPGLRPRRTCGMPS